MCSPLPQFFQVPSGVPCVHLFLCFFPACEKTTFPACYMFFKATISTGFLGPPARAICDSVTMETSPVPTPCRIWLGSWAHSLFEVEAPTKRSLPHPAGPPAVGTPLGSGRGQRRHVEAEAFCRGGKCWGWQPHWCYATWMWPRGVLATLVALLGLVEELPV